eukprot:871152-Rhodomonas_salina.1
MGTTQRNTLSTESKLHGPAIILQTSQLERLQKLIAIMSETREDTAQRHEDATISREFAHIIGADTLAPHLVDWGKLDGFSNYNSDDFEKISIPEERKPTVRDTCRKVSQRIEPYLLPPQKDSPHNNEICNHCARTAEFFSGLSGIMALANTMGWIGSAAPACMTALPFLCYMPEKVPYAIAGINFISNMNSGRLGNTGWDVANILFFENIDNFLTRSLGTDGATVNTVRGMLRFWRVASVIGACVKPHEFAATVASQSLTLLTGNPISSITCGIFAIALFGISRMYSQNANENLLDQSWAIATKERMITNGSNVSVGEKCESAFSKIVQRTLGVQNAQSLALCAGVVGGVGALLNGDVAAAAQAASGGWRGQLVGSSAQL